MSDVYTPVTVLVTVYLPNHGEFKATEWHVNNAMAYSRSTLAKSIAESYQGNGNPEYCRTAYWVTYPKFTLAIVLAGLQHPKN